METWLWVAGPARQHGAALHLLDQPRPAEDLQVTAYGHVGDAEALGQVTDPRPARAPDVLQDQRLPVLGDHLSALPRRNRPACLLSPCHPPPPPPSPVPTCA